MLASDDDTAITVLRKYASKMLMLLNFKIKIRLLCFLSPPNDNKFVTFYKDCPIKVPGKGTSQRWFFDFQFLYNPWRGGLHNPGGWAFIKRWWGFIIRFGGFIIRRVCVGMEGLI